MFQFSCNDPRGQWCFTWLTNKYQLWTIIISSGYTRYWCTIHTQYFYYLNILWTPWTIRKGVLSFYFLTLSRRRPISYRNQSIDLLCKSTDWFLYDIGLRLERVKCVFWTRIWLDNVLQQIESLTCSIFITP